MKAFVEITGAIVRVGPETDRYGADFDFAYALVASGGRAEIKALNGSGGTKAHFDAGMAALAPFNFSEIAYERTDHHGPRSFVLSSGPNGEVSMRRHTGKTPQGRKTPHPHEAFNDDGTINQMSAIKWLMAAATAWLSGEYTTVDMDEGQVTSENLDTLAKLGGHGQPGDEYFLGIRRRAK